MDQPKKVVIVGGVAGGAACAARLRRVSEEAEIIMLERGPHPSFANCGLPYYLGGVIPHRSDLLVATPSRFRHYFRIDVRTRNEAIRIDREKKVVEIRDLEKDRVYTESYDALVLAPGSAPIRPPLPGIDLPGIFTLRNIPDVEAINAWIAEKTPASAVVVGGGFIGLEMAENLVRRGLEVTLIEKMPQVMMPLDTEMAANVHVEIRNHGVDLQLGTGVAGFRQSEEGIVVETETGDIGPTGMVILAIGVQPDTILAKEAGLELGLRDAIRVDEKMRTSDPSIWAVGDAVEVRSFITGEPVLLPLAGPAARQGRIAAETIMGLDRRFRGVQGTAVVAIFGLTVASTGLNERTLRASGTPFEKIYLHPAQHVGYYPGASPIEMKVLFTPEEGKILGAQAVGRKGVEKRIDVVSTAIQFGGTVFDLEETELCYAPPYGAAKDPVNMIGFIAANHLRGESPVVHWSTLEELYADRPEGAEMPFILDVREPGEYEATHVSGSTLIPLPQLRDRLDEIPRDRQIWVVCGVGQRAHYAVRILRQKGFDARNLSGGIRTFTSGTAGKMIADLG